MLLYSLNTHITNCSVVAAQRHHRHRQPHQYKVIRRELQTYLWIWTSKIYELLQ